MILQTEIQIQSEVAGTVIAKLLGRLKLSGEKACHGTQETLTTTTLATAPIEQLTLLKHAQWNIQ